MSKLPDEIFDLIRDNEVKIRGHYLRFSAKVEGSMAKCVILLNEIKTVSSGTETKIDFKNFMFNQKLKKFESLVSEIYPDLALSYSALFDHIDSFRELRNKMTHCYFTWDESDLTSVTIWDLDDSGKIQKIEPTRYSLVQINSSFAQSTIDIVEDLNRLTEEIIARAKPVIPHMF